MTSTFDPLATSELIIDGYRRYLKSLLPVRDARIAAALEQEISRSLADQGTTAGIRATIRARRNPG